MSEPNKPDVKAPGGESRQNLAKVIGGFQPGDMIAERYQVVRMLGKGGMGIVYLANDTKRDRQVALKTLLPQYATNQQAVGRFVREVNAVRQLNHPGIVKILAARQYKSLLYYTMEYLDGKTDVWLNGQLDGKSDGASLDNLDKDPDRDPESLTSADPEGY